MPARKASAAVGIPTKRLKSGFEVPVLGIGTWRMGGDFRRDPQNDDARDIAALRRALELGFRHIDTAELYADGHAEELVGGAIREWPREELFLASKVNGAHLGYERVLKAARDSLERLGTDYLDLYLVHWPNQRFAIEETMRAMDELVKEGLVRNIGVSNFSKESLAKAQACAESRIVCDQVHYNLIVREPEKTGLLKYCQKKDVMLIAYRPLQLGEIAVPGTKVLDEMCEKYEKTHAQVTLNWLISQKNVAAIVKAGREMHLRENLGAVGWSLSPKDVERLRKEYPIRAPSEVGPLG